MSRKIKISYERTDSLTPAPYNPRTMTEEARARLARGIKEFGLVDPLVVRRSDRLIIGGHQRHTVAQSLGMDTVPVVFVDDLDDNQTAALNVLLNNPSAQGTWDYARLSDVLSSLDSEGFDATLTGFDLPQLEHLLAHEWPTPTDEAPPPDVVNDGGDDDTPSKGSLLKLIDVSVREPSYQPQKGQTWKVGRHILCVVPVMDGWPQWVPHLRGDVVFCPYPGPFVPLGLKAATTTLIMVQPNTYIAGHLLDRYAEVHGPEAVSEMTP